MKVLLIADVDSNSGPANVHKELVRCWPKEDELRVISVENPLLQQLKTAESSKWADVSLLAGRGWSDYISHQILRKMKTPVVIFNHGYMPYENSINGHGFSKRKVKAAMNDLLTAAAVVANSELQADFLKSRLPELCGIVEYIHLGVNSFQQKLHSKTKPSGFLVAVSGGDRLIKGNDVVIEAVREMRGSGLDVTLNIYGEVQNDARLKEEWINCRGQVEREQFLMEIESADCFVMNSRHEPFGLSAIDAIEAGASVVFSQNCGVTEILDVEDADIVGNCEDVAEVRDKLTWVLNNPNAKRLFNSIQFEESSWDTSARKLREICIKVAEFEAVD